ncbi:hypothetical protein GGF46_005406 [Coemansia sp. RSA 552]|nr:hypothetical protein GGF46_005406 [Coemansia sp. RSA 552]
MADIPGKFVEECLTSIEEYDVFRGDNTLLVVYTPETWKAVAMKYDQIVEIITEIHGEVESRVISSELLMANEIDVPEDEPYYVLGLNNDTPMKRTSKCEPLRMLSDDFLELGITNDE